MNLNAFTVALLLLATKSYAQDIATLPAGDDRIVTLHLSQPAPFEGQLFDNNTALRWGFWLQQYKLRLKLDVDTANKTCSVRLDNAASVLKIQADTATLIQKDLRERLVASEKARLLAEDDARNPPWYRS